MNASTSIKQRRRTICLIVGVSALVGLLAAVLSTHTIGLFPPKVGPRIPPVAGAQLSVVVDDPRSRIVDHVNESIDYNAFRALERRADYLAGMMVTQPVLEHIARHAGIPWQRIAAERRVTGDVPFAFTDPVDEKRAHDIWRSTEPYRILVQYRPQTSMFDIAAQAPTVGEAERLADASLAGLRDYVTDASAREGLDPALRLQLEPLGRVRGAVMNAMVPAEVAVLTFGLAFAVTCGGLLLLLRPRLRRLWARGGVGEDEARPPPGPGPMGDWPRTTRVLPWMLAAMLAVIWIVPFNAIQLRASLPVDLKFDRLVLPVIFVTWVLVVAHGGRGAPRLRLTPIHMAVFAFGAAATLSVVLNAGSLNQTLELGMAIKALPLLFGFIGLFVLTASIVRRSEVPAFLNYTLILAVIMAIGLIWEFRFHYNVFYDMSARLLPSIFQVGHVDSSAIDEIGRPEASGPAAIGLEAVAMLTMALPIALVGLLQASTRRERILYGLAACLLLAAAFSTFRKSALMGPGAVFLTLAYFRRRELVKMLPLGMVLLVVVHFIAPGALGSTTIQLSSNRLGATTVSDRTSDYDAVRPDIWTHLMIGRGWGSYDHTSYRILDNEFLHRAIEMGVVGVLAFAFLGVSVIATGRATIRARTPVWSPIALACAAAAVAFLVVSFLFDTLAFPHVPYIFLSLAGLLAVVVRPDASEEGAPDAEQEMDDPAVVELRPPVEEPALV